MRVLTTVNKMVGCAKTGVGGPDNLVNHVPTVGNTASSFVLQSSHTMAALNFMSLNSGLAAMHAPVLVIVIIMSSLCHLEQCTKCQHKQIGLSPPSRNHTSRYKIMKASEGLIIDVYVS